MQSVTHFTAKDLLHLMLEYRKIWASRSNSKPAEIRRKRIEALQEAFGLSKSHINPNSFVNVGLTGKMTTISRVAHLAGISNLNYLLNEEFLNDRDEELNRELIERAKEILKQLYPYNIEEIEKGRFHLFWLYNNLIRFREEVFSLTYPDGGMLEGFSPGLLYSKYLKENLKKVVRTHILEIDEVLSMILDPQKRQVEKETLINQYGYPDVNLDELDHAFWIEDL